MRRKTSHLRFSILDFRFSILGLIIAFILLALTSGSARAHANLLRSTPEANAALDTAPVLIELFFSEPVEPAFSTVTILDTTGKRVDNEDATVDPADPTRMTVTMRSVPNGIYTVSWKALSSVDSHVTAGAFPFAVGKVDEAALAAAAQSGTQISLSLGEVIGRWILYITGAALSGGTLFIVAVWEPAYRRTRAASENAPSLAPPWRKLDTAMILALMLGGVFWLLVQAGQASGSEIAAPWNRVVGRVLATTRFGSLWLARFAIALFMLYLSREGERGRAGIRWLAFVSALLLLLTTSMGSHAVAEPRPFWPIFGDWVHLVAASVWVGGLIYLVAALRTVRGAGVAPGFATQLTARLFPRFSALAAISVALMALSGGYSAVLRVGSWQALLETFYGQILVAKSVLALLMLILGALNLLHTSPNVRRSAQMSEGKPRLLRRFQKLVGGEVGLAIILLLSVGVFTAAPPARAISTQPILKDSMPADDLDIAIDITPGRVGPNTFTITVSKDGKPLENAKEVALQFTPTTANLPPSEIYLEEIGGGEYAAESANLGLPDNWQVQAVVRREGQFDAFANFTFNVGTSVQLVAWYVFSGVALVIAAPGYFLALRGAVAGRGRKQQRWLEQAPVLALFVCGLLFVYAPPLAEKPLPVNPIPPNAGSIRQGEAIYKESCLACHGPTGRGDGPIGLTLNPRPADLVEHTIPGVHPDGRLFNWISDGFGDSPMPAFKGAFEEEDRWHIVNYIRTLADEE